VEKTLAVFVVALGLLGFYATSAAVTVFHAVMTFNREVPTVPPFVSSSQGLIHVTGVWDSAEGNNTTRPAEVGNLFSCSDRGMSDQQREGCI